MNELNLNTKFFFLMIGLLLVNLIQSAFTPITADEAYYWVWSQHLDWGYFDHPPMNALWIAIGSKIFGGTLGVRFVGMVLNAAALFFLFKILEPKTDKQFRIFTVLTVSCVVIQFFGFIATPDSPLLFFCILYLFSFKRFLEKSSFINALLFAFSIAGLMYSKYHGLLLILFTILPVFGKLLKNPRFYLAVFFSLILYLPHLIWIFKHDFIPLQYHLAGRNSDESFDTGIFLLYPVYFFLGMSPLLSWLSAKSLFGFKAKTDFQKSIWWLAILTGIFFFVTAFNSKVQPQWLLISFVAMMIIFYQFYAEKENDKWLIRLGLMGIVLIFVVRIGLMIPGISPLFVYTDFVSELKKYKTENVLFEKYQEASVFLFYNPDKKVSVHRTLGNRESQYSLWDWEDDFNGKTVDYISPWVRSDKFVIGPKKMKYYIKTIPDYISYYKLKIETIDELKTHPNEEIKLKISVFNGHHHPLTMGDDSKLKLNVNYYVHKQHQIIYSTEIPVKQMVLQPGETKNIEINFKNIDETGSFKANFGIHYTELGTSYQSETFRIISE